MKITSKQPLILFIFLSSFIFAQENTGLGINTKEPTKVLDINGNLRIRELNLEEDQSEYSRVLVTNSLGEVESVKITDLKAELSGSEMENKHLYYTGTNPDDSQVLTCGKFQFSYGLPQDTALGKNLDIRMNLKDGSAGTVNIYYTLFRKWGDGAKKYYKSYFLPFTSVNSTVPQRLSAGLDQNEFAEIYLTHPQERNYYRVSFIARQNFKDSENVMNNSYTIICEKF